MRGYGSRAMYGYGNMGDGIDLSSILGGAESGLLSAAGTVLPAAVAGAAGSALQQSAVQQSIQQSAASNLASNFMANWQAWAIGGAVVLGIVYFLGRK